MGCLRNLGCLVVIIVIAAIAWIFRADLMPLVQRTTGRSAPVTTTPKSETWEPVTPDGATRAREAVQKLGVRSGPVFANLTPGDLLSYVYQELQKQLPPSTRNIEAAVFGDQLWVRADVKPGDLGAQSLGPLAGMLGEREPVRFGGTLDIVRPGLAEFRVQSVRIRDLSLPKAMIPKLLQSNDTRAHPKGVAPDALPLPIPTYIADVRIHSGKITLYKAIP
jgi:hypothetical protein